MGRLSRVSVPGGGEFCEPPSLAPLIRSGEGGAMVGFRELHRVAGECSPFMGDLPCVDGREAYRTVQAARVLVGWSWRDLAPPCGEVFPVRSAPGDEAACGTEQLAVGVEAGIEG